MIEPSRFLEATMHSVTTKKAALATLLVLAALLSIFAVGKRASDPAYHQASIDALAEKQETVLELTAASTAASAAITLLPGRHRDAHRRKARRPERLLSHRALRHLFGKVSADDHILRVVHDPDPRSLRAWHRCALFRKAARRAGEARVGICCSSRSPSRLPFPRVSKSRA